jgi:hypothetical protein
VKKVFHYFANKPQIDAGISAEEADAEKIEKEFLTQERVA